MGEAYERLIGFKADSFIDLSYNNEGTWVGKSLRSLKSMAFTDSSWSHLELTKQISACSVKYVFQSEVSVFDLLINKEVRVLSSCSISRENRGRSRPCWFNISGDGLKWRKLVTSIAFKLWINCRTASVSERKEKVLVPLSSNPSQAFWSFFRRVRDRLWSIILIRLTLAISREKSLFSLNRLAR